MTNVVLTNAMEELSRSRMACPGLGEEVYDLLDYMAKIVNSVVTPNELFICFLICISDIKRFGKECFVSAECRRILQYLSENKKQVLTHAVYVPQIIDAIADETFAKEFRSQCRTVLNYDPPIRYEKFDLFAYIEGEYPQYAKVAANWWANAIVNPNFDVRFEETTDCSENILLNAINSKKSITNDQIKIFKEELANIIYQRVNSSDRNFRLAVDFFPDHQLKSAAKKAGIEEMNGFPWKTYMYVTEEKITVLTGFLGNTSIIWKKKA